MHFFDIFIPRGDIPTAHIQAELLRALHPLYKGNVAVSYPRAREGDTPSLGTALRLHGEEGVLEVISKHLQGDTRLGSRVALGVVREVPATIKGLVEYRRVRIPSRKFTGALPEKQARRRCNAVAYTRQLPYISVKSFSTNQAFSLFFKRIKHSAGEPVMGEPDSYGLSKASRPCLLPDF